MVSKKFAGQNSTARRAAIARLRRRNFHSHAVGSFALRQELVFAPFLCQPPRHYLGAAWYQRDIEIPEAWTNRRVVLFLERPHWESRVWLDDQLVGTNNSLCTPHEFELGVSLKPGKHRLTVRVDNRMILPYRPDAHSVSDSLGQSWNGIVGKMELRNTPLVWIDQVIIIPYAQERRLGIAVKIGNATGKADFLRVNVRDGVAKKSQSTSFMGEANWDTIASRGDSAHYYGCLIYPYDLNEKARCWDEFSPVLQHAYVELYGGPKTNLLETREITYGLCNFLADGNRFLINGRETYLRGTHFGGDFPLTGYPPTDVESWRRIFQTCKDWGLNHMRFHSFCPPDAAFEAADELGFYLQIEPGTWNEFSPGGAMEKMLYDETERIIKYYGNHPSFVLMSASNEAHGNWKPVLAKWVEHFRAADPRRLYTPDTGWAPIDAPGPVTNADYLAVGRIGQNRVRGESAWFGRDYERSLRGLNVPVVAHELGQWCAYPGFDVIKKFTGYMRPGNYEIFRDSAERHGVLEYNKKFAWASGRFQFECYKEEIEANLRTPGMAGFQLLDLHDYVGQGTALVGVLDPFWESKGYATPDEFKQFCNTVVPLARLTKRVFAKDEKFEVPVEIANFGGFTLTNIPINWEILDVSNVVMENGWLGATVPVGKNFPLGKISVDLSMLPAPARYKLLVDGQNPYFANDWNFWLYPATNADAVPQNVFITSSWDDAEAKLNSGARVLFLPRNADLAWDCPPLDVVPVFWNRLMNPAWSRMLGLWCDTNHPALAEFPTESNCDWQWTQITRGVRPVNLEKLPRGLQPIVSAIDDWNRNWKLGAIFECKVGAGKLLVCAFDLERDLENRPVARQLRRSLLDYMAGEKFQPTTEISVADFRALHFDSRIMRKLAAKATSDAGDASAAIDSDPNTSWISGEVSRNRRGTPHPHWLAIDFPKPIALNGFTIIPRQNDRDHLGDVREYKIKASDDGQTWREVKRGELASTWSPQKIQFSETITAKQIKFTSLSGFGNDTSAALAELAVNYAGPKLPAENSANIEYRRSRSTSSDVDESIDSAASRTNRIHRNP
jgi:beta-galactosidase